MSILPIVFKSKFKKKMFVAYQIDFFFFLNKIKTEKFLKNRRDNKSDCSFYKNYLIPSSFS